MKPSELTRRAVCSATVLVLALVLTLSPRDMIAQALTLQDAVSRATVGSDDAGIARAAVERAAGNQMTARSQRFPQVQGSVGYTRTLRSQFDAFRSEFGAISDLPFGQRHEYTLGMGVSQLLYAGGRQAASEGLAGSVREVAELELAAAVAGVEVQVTEAYYDAVLAARLAELARQLLAQADEALRITEASVMVGGRAEFDLLRARVTRDNLLPVVTQREGDLEVALLRLRQLVGLPMGTPLQLATPLPDRGETESALRTVSAAELIGADERVAVQMAFERLRGAEYQLRMRRSERFPAVNVMSQYGRIGYPAHGSPVWSDFRDNWTVGVAVQLPLFTGGRLAGIERTAQADLLEARHGLRSVERGAELDAAALGAQLREAEGVWRASDLTVTEAERAHAIAEVRYREGLSTALELTEARTSLQQAEVNAAVATRNVHVLLTRLRLLRDLPVQGSANVLPGAGVRTVR